MPASPAHRLFAGARDLIEEQRRRAFLGAMQITSWLPRQPLPFAAPSRLELLETPSREEPVVSARAAVDLPQARVPQAEAPTAASSVAPVVPAEGRGIPISLPKPGAPAAKKAEPLAPVEEAPAEPPVVQAPPPRFALQLLQAGPCALLVELPTGEPFASRDPGYLLLRDLLRAAGLPDSPRLIGEPVRWPLLARGNLDQGPQAALEFVQSFVAARLEEGERSRCLWLVGLPAIRFAGEGDEGSLFRELQVEGLGAAWAVPGLETLMEEPALKGELWRAMRRVRQRWSSEIQ